MCLSQAKLISTSPSMYLEFAGTMGVSDYCGPVGSPLTSQLVAFPPGALSTYEASYASIGQEYVNPLDEIYHGMDLQPIPSPKPLKIQDLQCPTFGVGTTTDAQGANITTIGPPWLPMISPPPEILTLNAEWNRICMGNLTFNTAMKSLAIFDPPHVLVPGKGLAPDPTHSAEVNPTSANAQPVQTPKPSLPIQTEGPSRPLIWDPRTRSDRPARQSSLNPHVPHNGDSGAAGSGTLGNEPSQRNSQGSPHISSGPPTPDQTVPSRGNDPAASVDLASKPKPNENGNVRSSSTELLNDGSTPGGNSSHKPEFWIDNSIVQGLGRNPQSDPNAPDPDPSNFASSKVEPKHSPGVGTTLDAEASMSISSAPLAPAATGFSAAGTNPLPQGPRVTAVGTVISLAASDGLILGSQTFGTFPSSSSRVDPTLGLQAGGQSFTAAAPGSAIAADTSKLPNPPTTITPESSIIMDSPHLHILNSKTIPLSSIPNSSQFSASRIITTASSQVLTLDSTGAAVAGTSVLSEAVSVTMSSTQLSPDPLQSRITVTPAPTEADQSIPPTLTNQNPIQTSTADGVATATISAPNGDTITEKQNNQTITTTNISDSSNSIITFINPPTQNTTGHITVGVGNRIIIPFEGDVNTVRIRSRLLISIVTGLTLLSYI